MYDDWIKKTKNKTTTIATKAITELIFDPCKLVPGYFLELIPVLHHVRMFRCGQMTEGGTKGETKGVQLTAALWLKTPNYGNEQRCNYIP